LIGRTARRPDLKTIRRIKRALRGALGLPDDAVITVAELACREEGCAPLETVVGLLRPGAPHRQHKLHKATAAIDLDDLVRVCTAWDLEVERSVLQTFFELESSK